MTAQSSANLHYVGPGFANQVEVIRVIWDFAVDGGEADDTIKLLQFKTAGTIVWGYVKVLTTCVGASGTIIVGTTSDVDCIMDISGGAVANLVANFIPAVGDQVLPSHFAADDYLLMDIATTDMSAGKFEVVIGILP